MIASTLKTVTQEHIQKVVTREIWQRGYQYFRRNSVLTFNRSDYTITASIRGTAHYPYQVHIVESDGSIAGMSCTCPYSSRWGWVCKHIVAVLLTWIHQRDSGNYDFSLDSREPAVQNSRQDDGISASPLSGVLSSWFSLSEPLQTSVDLDDNGPKIKITLHSGKNERTAVLVVPASESPEMLQRLRSMANINFSEQAARVRFLKHKVSYALRAEYDEGERLIITPGYKIKDEQENQTFTPRDDPGYVRVNDTWLWSGGTYIMVEQMPEELEPFFNGQKPLLYAGTDIIDFFTYSMPVLGHKKGFLPSEQVKNTRILPVPKLSTVRVEEAGDWLYLAPYYETGGISLGMDDIKSRNGEHGFIRKGNDWVHLSDDVVKRWDGAGTHENGRIKVSRLSYAKVRAELGDGVLLEEPPSVESFYSVLNRVTDSGSAPLPYDMHGQLRDYQKAGYDWLYYLYDNQFNGVLADEMGLGKTHQTMALFSTIYGNGASLPTIVVAPTSVMDHWESKLREYVPWISVNRYYDKTRSLDARTPYHVVLTTYSVLVRDIDILSQQQWEYVVLDEAQKIKNYTTKAYTSCKLLKARHRLALTGTPIENRLTELWAIFDFLMPGYLGSLKKFVQDYEIPVTKYNDTGKIQILKKVIHPFKLRRLKSDVLNDLPPKVEDVRYCTLTQHQVALYKRFAETGGKTLIKKLNDTSKPVDYLHIFALITKLKRLCDHPVLVSRSNTPSASSAKFELFKELMTEAIDSGEKIVVFSQYLGMLSLIEQWLTSKHITVASLRGSTRNRADVIGKFQEDPGCRVFVGSLLAGGLGIDLTSASVVIHYDRWWNAAREDQATDRVHRIGQKKSVQVFKLITRGTLEEKIDTIIQRKSSLMNSIVESDEALLKKLTRSELIELLQGPVIPPSGNIV